MVDFDYILDRLGPFGRYQKLHWIIAYLVIIPKGFHNILNVYLFATPDHWCSLPELSNLSIAEQRLLTAPGSDLTSDVASCFVRDVDYREVYLTYVTNGIVLYNGTDTRPCTDWAYDHDMYGTTAVTKVIVNKGQSINSIGDTWVTISHIIFLASTFHFPNL